MFISQPSSFNCALRLGEMVCLASSLRCVCRLFKGASLSPFWCLGFWNSTLFMRDTTIREIIEKHVCFKVSGSGRGGAHPARCNMVLVLAESVRSCLDVFKPRSLFLMLPGVASALSRHAVGFHVILHHGTLLHLVMATPSCDTSHGSNTCLLPMTMFIWFLCEHFPCSHHSFCFSHCVLRCSVRLAVSPR